MSLFDITRQALMTLLRADHVQLDPPPRTMARHIVRRRLDRVELQANGVPIDGTDAKIQRLTVVARDMRLRITSRRPKLSVGEARFTAHLTEQQLGVLVTLPPGVERLSITERGVTLHTIAGIPIATVIRLEEGNRVHVTLAPPARLPLLDLFGIDIALPQFPPGGGLDQLARFGRAFDLPPLPAGARIEQIEPVAGAMRLSGTLDLFTER